MDLFSHCSVNYKSNIVISSYDVLWIPFRMEVVFILLLGGVKTKQGLSVRTTLTCLGVITGARGDEMSISIGFGDWWLQLLLGIASTNLSTTA